MDHATYPRANDYALTSSLVPVRSATLKLRVEYPIFRAPLIALRPARTQGVTQIIVLIFDLESAVYKPLSLRSLPVLKALTSIVAKLHSRKTGERPARQRR